MGITATPDRLQVPRQARESLPGSSSFGRGCARCTILWALVLSLFGLLAPSPVLGAPPWVWHQAKGPTGGRVQALAVSPAQPDLVLAGTPLGLFRSLDAGASWQRLASDEESSRQIVAIVIDPHDASRIWVGGKAGLRSSADGGATWRAAEGDLSWVPIHSIALHASSGILYAGSGQGAYRSADGVHWEPRHSGLPRGPVWSLQIHPANPHVVYAATDQGVFVTGDGGALWYPSSQGLPPQEPVHGIVLDPHAPQRLYASTGLGAFASVDAGVTWRPLDAAPRRAIDVAHVIDALHGQSEVEVTTLWPLLEGTEFPLYPGVMLDGARVLALAAHPTVGGLWYLGTARGFYRSEDGGLTWQDHNHGLLAAEVLALALWPDHRGRLIAATPWGLSASEDGGSSWRALSREPRTTAYTMLAVDPCGESAFAASPAGQIVHLDSALRESTSASIPLASGVVLQHLIAVREGDCPRGGLRLWAVDSAGGIRHSSDGGLSWGAATGLPAQGAIAAAVAAPASGSSSGLLLGIGSAVYQLLLQEGQPTARRLAIEGLDHPVRHLLPVPGRPQRLCVITAQGSLYRLIADGDTWRLQGQGALPHGVEPLDLAFVHRPGTSSLLWAVTRDGMLVSDDYGASWTFNRLTELEKAGVRRIAVSPEAPGVVYLASDHGGLYVGTPPARRSYWLFYVAGLLGLAALLWWLAHRYRTRWFRNEFDSLRQDALGWDAAIAAALAAQHRVTPDLLAGIPVQAREFAMRRYVETHRSQALRYQELPALIEPVRQAALEQFMQGWRGLVQQLDSMEKAAPMAARLAEQLCELLGFTPLERRTFGAWMGYMVEATSIRLSLPSRFPLMFLIREHVTSDDMRDLRTLMLNLNAISFFALLITGGDGLGQHALPKVLNLVRAGADDLIVLGLSDLCDLYLAADPPARLLTKILEQIDLSVVSPYVTSGPVPERMFFGRDYELKVLMRTLQDASYALVGGRKIGKTSILNKLQRLIERSGSMTAFYLDCHGVIDHETFFQALQIATSITAPSADPQAMRPLLVRLRRQRGLGNGLIVFLLDEAEYLVRYDVQHRGRLFQVLRALAHEGQCRFVICGERHLNHALHDPASPLFNTCRIMRLAYLAPRDVRRIIVEPMQEMGVVFEDREALVEAVIEMTSCHPNLVQAVCQGLIHEINARGDRHIRQDDLDRVRQAVGYPDLFLEVVWGNASTLERLITVTMIGRGSFSLEQVRGALAAQGCHCGVSEIARALGNLELTAFYERHGSQYVPLVRAFDALLIEAGLGEVLRQSLLETLLSEAGPSETLAD